jgi:uncharacterized protein (TIGR03000 family)
MGMFQPRMLNSSPLMGSSPASAMPYGGSGMYGMPSGGYGAYSMPSRGYGSPTLSTSAPEQPSRLPKAPTADDIEVSGPLNTPPPHRAIVRVRLPRTWADVAFDGRKVDSMGRARTYVTPELSRARTFEVTVTWKNKGRTTRLQERVTVKAGHIRTVDFTSSR